MEPGLSLIECADGKILCNKNKQHLLPPQKKKGNREFPCKMYYLDVFRLNKLFSISFLNSFQGRIHREIIEQRLQTQMKELAPTEMKHFVELESICVLGKQLIVRVGGGCFGDP